MIFLGIYLTSFCTEKQYLNLLFIILSKQEPSLYINLINVYFLSRLAILQEFKGSRHHAW
jgi:hypothetical protein